MVESPSTVFPAPFGVSDLTTDVASKSSNSMLSEDIYRVAEEKIKIKRDRLWRRGNKEGYEI
jgi:hypothetical protein